MNEKSQARRKAIYISLYLLASFLFLADLGLIIYAWGSTRLSEGSWAILYMPYLLLAFLIPGVLLFVTNYLCAKHEVLKAKTRKSFIIALISVLVLGSAASVLPIEIKYHDLRTYSREKWLQSNPYYRGMMIDSFIEQVDLVGGSADNVVYYLGEPLEKVESEQESQALEYHYDLGFYFDYMDPTMYVVTLNETNIVVSASY
jgi:hypothetical protein